MIKIIITFLYYIFLIFNTSLVASENDEKLRVGLLAPFSGEYKNLGESLLLSTQLALDEIDNDNIIIIPRDSGWLAICDLVVHGDAPAHLMHHLCSRASPAVELAKK